MPTAYFYYNSTLVASVPFTWPVSTASPGTPQYVQVTAANSALTLTVGTVTVFNNVLYTLDPNAYYDTPAVGFSLFTPNLSTSLPSSSVMTIANIQVDNVYYVGTHAVINGDLATTGNLAGSAHASLITSGTIDPARLPAASVTTPGIVQLSDSTTTASSLVAATSKAVKAVQDQLATTAATATSALPTTGGTVTGALSVTGPVRLPNTVVRSYRKFLGNNVGDGVDIVSMYSFSGSFAFRLNVVQSIVSNSLSKVYDATLRSDNTLGVWQLLVPTQSSGPWALNDWAVDIIQGGSTPGVLLRLRRTAAGPNVAGDITCVLTVMDAISDSVTFTDSTTTYTALTAPTAIYSMTPLTRVPGKVGVQQPAPAYELDVSGDVNFTGTLRQNGVAVVTPTGVLGSAAMIPNLDASKITSGALNPILIPSLDASKITGTLDPAVVPSLDATKITTGTLGTTQIPNLDAGKITTGTVATARLPVATTAGVVGVTSLSSSTASASSMVAATSAAVKTVNDALTTTTATANAALPKAGGTVTGALTVGGACSVASLASSGAVTSTAGTSSFYITNMAQLQTGGVNRLDANGDGTLGNVSVASVKIPNAAVMEFGATGVTKEGNAGKIGYQAFTGGCLDIVGAGTTGNPRVVKIYENLIVAGSLSVGGSAALKMDYGNVAGGSSGGTTSFNITFSSAPQVFFSVQTANAVVWSTGISPTAFNWNKSLAAVGFSWFAIGA